MTRLLKSVAKLGYRNIYKCQVIGTRKCTTTATSGSSSQIKSDVPGLSKNTVDISSGEVGFPGASKKSTYKNPEYFCYHNTSYFEAEVEMKKYRLPQPSNKSTK